MATAPKRHWFSFSLRTLFVAVTFSSIFLGWLIWCLTYIKQRNEALNDHGADITCSDNLPNGEPHSPWMLRLFGEPGFQRIVLMFQGDVGCDISGPLTENQQVEFKRIQRLFPEALPLLNRHHCRVW